MKPSKYRIFVFANLKPSQIDYKIIPLSRSAMVEHVYILRKTPLKINDDKITCFSLPWILRQRPIYWFLTSFYGIILMRKHHTNIILSYNIFPHGFNAYLASKISKQQAIFSEINEDTIHYYQKFLPQFLVKLILKNARVICTPGTNTASFWNKAGYSNTYQLHSTIDTFKFQPDSTLEKKYDYLYIGTLDINKRPELIIDSFNEIHKKINTVSLCIIGFGELEKELKKKIVNLNLEDSITFIRTNDVLKYIQKSKIFVMASLSEGLPCALMEAMACELIAIVPPVGDIADVIEHKANGYLFDNSKEQLCTFMEEAFTNYNMLSKMRTNARDTIINKHSYLVATAKWNALLGEF